MVTDSQPNTDHALIKVNSTAHPEKTDLPLLTNVSQYNPGDWEGLQDYQGVQNVVPSKKLKRFVIK